MFKFGRFFRLTVGSAVLTGVVVISSAVAQTSLLNVSYDPTRELYKDYNAAFAKHWQAKTGQTVNVDGGIARGLL